MSFISNIDLQKKKKKIFHQPSKVPLKAFSPFNQVSVKFSIVVDTHLYIFLQSMYKRAHIFRKGKTQYVKK